MTLNQDTGSTTGQTEPDDSFSPEKPDRSARWQPPSLEEMQAMLPQYEFITLLGRGGMGAVYKAVQKSLQREVALKILPADLSADDDVNFVERFKNEARLMARLRHPAIVDVYDFGETPEGLLYIAMEYMDGTDVARMIQSQGRLKPKHALAITAHVCDALACAHQRGIIHRDIKPANILIAHDGTVKVADFGLAKQSDPALSSLTRTNIAVGTPDFLAPEALIPGVALDGRADLYALGVTLYQMLTGELPRGIWKMPGQKLGIDPRFDAIISKALQAEREARYSSVWEIRRELDLIMTTPPPREADAEPKKKISAPAATIPTVVKVLQAETRPHGTSKTRPDVWIAVAVVLSVLGVIFWLVVEPLKPAQSPETAAIVADSKPLPAPVPLTGDEVPSNQRKPDVEPATPLKPAQNQVTAAALAIPKPLPAPVRLTGAKVRSNEWISVIDPARSLKNDEWQDGWLNISKGMNILHRLEEGGTRLDLPPENYLNQAVRLRMKRPSADEGETSIILRKAFGNPGAAKVAVLLTPSWVSANSTTYEPESRRLTTKTLGQLKLSPSVREAVEWLVEAEVLDKTLSVNINGEEVLRSEDVTVLSPGGANINLLRKDNTVTWAKELSFRFIDSWIDLISLLDLQRDVTKGRTSKPPPVLALKGSSLTNPGKTPTIVSFPAAIRGTEFVIQIEGVHIRKDYPGGFISLLLPVGDKALEVNFNSSGQVRRYASQLIPPGRDWAVQGSPTLLVYCKLSADGKDAELKVQVGDRESDVWRPGPEGLSRYLYSPQNEGWRLAREPCIHMLIGATVSEIESIQLKMIQGKAEPLLRSAP